MQSGLLFTRLFVLVSKFFGISTLAQQRTSIIVLFIYQLFRGVTSFSEFLSLISFNNPAQNIRNYVLFAIPYSKVSVFKCSFVNKCMHAANEFLLTHPTFDLFFQSSSNLKMLPLHC